MYWVSVSQLNIATWSYSYIQISNITLANETIISALETVTITMYKKLLRGRQLLKIILEILNISTGKRNEQLL